MTARPGGRVRTPTTLQMEAVECGAAALSMVLGHHGRHVPLEELRIACDITRDGSKASNLVKAARRYGMEAGGVRCDVPDLAELTPPAILFWNFNHFVVFEGMRRRFGRTVAHVNDPASGRRAVGAEEFDAAFTGLVLTFEPGPEFRRGGARPSAVRDLLARLRQVRSAMAIVVLAGLLTVVVGLAMPASSRAFVDSFLVGGHDSLLVPFFAAVVVTILLVVAVTAVQQTYLLRAQIFASTSSSARFMRHVLRLPVRFFDQRSPADVAQRLDSNDTVAEILGRTTSTVVTSGLIVLVYAGLLWSYDPRLTLVGVVIALLNIGLVRLIARLRREAVAKVRIDEAKFQAVSFDGLQLIETLKAVGGEQDFFRRWAAQQALVLQSRQRSQVPSAVLAGAIPALGMLNSMLILLIGGLQAIGGALSIGVLIAFQTLVRTFNTQVGELAEVGPQVQDVGADVARLRDVETAGEDAVFARGADRDDDRDDPAARLSGTCSFRGVTFGYSRLSPPLIDKLSFDVAPGRQLAIVGESGSGKSTVTRLISGLHEPWQGEIRFGDRPHDRIPREVLAASVAFVDQEIFLFEGSVRDNVALWNPAVEDETVIRALRDADVYDVVTARPGHIHARVEQDGRNFSGGQRQRLEIARALARSASIMVLDEATSALDAETEQRVHANLRRRGCALVVIAHRLSTVRDSDEILVLDAGEVVERGTHDVLMDLDGAYARLAGGMAREAAP